MSNGIAELLFFVNAGLTAIILLDGASKKSGYLQIPFLFAVIYAAWFLPQVAVLLYDNSLPPYGVARLMAMSALCLSAVWLGWFRGAEKRTVVRQTAMSERLVWAAAFLTMFAIAVRLAILSQPDDVRAASQWSGPITILALLSNVGAVALILSLGLATQKPTYVSIGLALTNVSFYVAPLIISFRRSNTFEFVFAILLALFFLRSWTVPRYLSLLGVAVAFAFINNVGELRFLGGAYSMNAEGRVEARIPDLSDVISIDWFNFKKIEDAKYISEARNAVIYMDAVDMEGVLSLGAELWNRLVFAYVPGQIVGFDLKMDLMLGESLSSIALRRSGYVALVGTTATGFSHLYSDFWFFGSMAFFLIGMFMRRVFDAARYGSFKAMCIYAALLPLALQSCTHFGYYVFVNSLLPLLAIWFSFRFFGERSVGFSPSLRRPIGA